MKRAQAGCLTIHVDRLLDLGKSTALDRAAEQHLGAEIMARGIELECAFANVQPRPFGPEMRRIAGVDADAGEHPGELLHVLLGVARVDAERVQLHELARVVLIDVAGGVLVVVQIRSIAGCSSVASTRSLKWPSACGRIARSA